MRNKLFHLLMEFPALMRLPISLYWKQNTVAAGELLEHLQLALMIISSITDFVFCPWEYKVVMWGVGWLLAVLVKAETVSKLFCRNMHSNPLKTWIITFIFLMAQSHYKSHFLATRKNWRFQDCTVLFWGFLHLMTDCKLLGATTFDYKVTLQVIWWEAAVILTIN